MNHPTVELLPTVGSYREALLRLQFAEGQDRWSKLPAESLAEIEGQAQRRAITILCEGVPVGLFILSQDERVSVYAGQANLSDCPPVECRRQASLREVRLASHPRRARQARAYRRDALELAQSVTAETSDWALAAHNLDLVMALASTHGQGIAYLKAAWQTLKVPVFYAAIGQFYMGKFGIQTLHRDAERVLNTVAALTRHDRIMQRVLK